MSIIYVWHDIIVSTKRNGFHKKECTPLSLTSYFFHRDSDANQTIIWLWPKQRQTSKNFCNFTYFVKILGSNICFPKISKSTHTVNLYSEFSCKSRFAKVDFATASYLWKPNLTFCLWDRPTVFFGVLKIRILIIFI